MFWTIIGSLFSLLLLTLLIVRLMVVRGGRGVVTDDPLSFVTWPNVPATAERLPHGDVEIRWDGASATHISALPNSPEQDGAMRIEMISEKGAIHMRPESNGRRVYTVHHADGRQTSVAERIWQLPSVLNLRDLGGYQAESGRVTAWGKIYRTAHLGNATAEDLAALQAHGIALVCDLRSNRELGETPDRIPAGASYQHTPIYSEDQLSAIFPKVLFDRASLGDQLGVGYIRMLDERAEAFAGIIGRFADPASLPAMFHCTAGKDRAGLTAAMLLSLLGVPRDTILADYSLSNLDSDRIFDDFAVKSGASISRFGVPIDQLRPLFVADPRWMENALAHIDAKYGGVESYLIKKGGMSAENVASLRQNLLV